MSIDPHEPVPAQELAGVVDVQSLPARRQELPPSKDKTIGVKALFDAFATSPDKLLYVSIEARQPNVRARELLASRATGMNVVQLFEDGAPQF